jgi:hypothetical protein
MTTNIAECPVCAQAHTDVEVTEIEGSATFICPVTGFTAPMTADEVTAAKECRTNE